MHVLFVLHTLDHGGMQTYLLQVVRELTAQGVSCSVLCFAKPLLVPDYRQAGAQVHCLGLDPFPQATSEEHVRKLCHLIPEIAADVIETKIVFCDTQVREAIRLLGGGRVVVSQHGFGDGWSPDVVAAELAQLHLTRKYVCVSGWCARTLRGYGIPAEQITVVHNGVDTSLFDVARTRQVATSDTGHRGGRYSVAFIGRLEHSKNPKMLKAILDKVLERRPTAKAIVVGDGSYRALFQHPRIDITGFVPHRRVPHFLAQSDILLLPSWAESFGNVLVEAGAMGLPVVATATGGTSEIVEHGRTGFLCTTEEEYEGRVLELMTDHKRATEMGNCAVARVRDCFDLPKQVQKRLRVYQEVGVMPWCTWDQ